MSLTAHVPVTSKPAQPLAAKPSIGLVGRSRILRDFVVLITVCLCVGLAFGTLAMAAVFALL
jgi:hypothetical protein